VVFDVVGAGASEGSIMSSGSSLCSSSARVLRFVVAVVLVAALRVAFAFDAAVAIFVILIAVSSDLAAARARVTRFGGDDGSVMMSKINSKNAMCEMDVVNQLH